MSKAKGNTLRFEPSASVQRLLGRDLISNEYIAIAELVKNAYDSGATELEIVFSNTKDNLQKLVVSDNGKGMSFAEFKRLWMRPGYSEKSDSNKLPSGRSMLGEKGIGRFAADKLAERLAVITKRKSESDALRVEFDWEKFNDQKKMLQDIPIHYTRVKDTDLVLGSSGTRLELEGLRKTWTQRDWQRLRQELQRLIAPSWKQPDFRIIANAEGWESGSVKSEFNPEGEYSYVFSINKKGKVHWSLSRPAQVAEVIRERAVITGSEQINNPFGFVSGRFYYVERPSAITRQGFEAGVGIYRDGFRVEPYGRESDDWLSIKSYRASRQGHAPVSPSRLFGYVEITREDNPKLRDITNREGIQDSVEFKAFRDFVGDQLRRFAGAIDEDKAELPLSPAIQAQQQQAKRLTRAQAFAQMASQLAHQLRQPLNHIQMSATNLTDRLELQGIEDEIIRNLADRIEKNVSRMSQNITSLSKVARGLRDEVVEIDLADFLNEQLIVHSVNFEQSQVRLGLEIVGDSHKIRFGRVALQFILDNFLSNALRAAQASNKSGGGEVLIKLEETSEGGHQISVRDNGVGIPPEHLSKLFNEFMASAHGDGTGLFWSKIWAEEYNGRISCQNLDGGAEFSIEF